MEEYKPPISEFPPLPSPSARIHFPAALTSAEPPQRKTSGIGQSNAFEIFLEEEEDSLASVSMEEDLPLQPPIASTTEDFRLPEFLEMVTKSTLTTDHLLISFLPDWIKLFFFFFFLKLNEG